MKCLNDLLSFKCDLKRAIVRDICDNSKLITLESMFVALNRNPENRKNHITEAISLGAKYILLEGDKNCVETIDNVLFVYTKNVRKELAHIASKFFQSSFDNVVAVTGTNGKSSTVDIIRQLWIQQESEAASIGTLGVITKESRMMLPNGMTSPDCLELHKILHRLKESGIKNIAMEASSQGIEQHRVDEIKFNICAFTNFSQDHLDYHGTLENYWKAKERLFSDLAHGDSIFIVNIDDKYSDRIVEIARLRHIKCVTYGYNSEEVKILNVEQGKFNRQVKVSFLGRIFSFKLPLRGNFQIYNAVCAAAVCHFSGFDIEKVIEKLENLRQIPGRLELITSINGADIYTDYAHTPDALKSAILSLRNGSGGRIIVVFGCGGNRDQKKRIIMGEVAGKFADVVVVTDDNPRDEDPAKIRKMILEGCSQATEIGDRKAAIESAIKMLNPEDVLIVAGKGHETYQQMGRQLLEFSDKEVILNAVKK